MGRYGAKIPRLGEAALLLERGDPRSVRGPLLAVEDGEVLGHVLEEDDLDLRRRREPLKHRLKQRLRLFWLPVRVPLGVVLA